MHIYTFIIGIVDVRGLPLHKFVQFSGITLPEFTTPRPVLALIIAREFNRFFHSSISITYPQRPILVVSTCRAINLNTRSSTDVHVSKFAKMII